ncbi:hypothetical protein OG212_22540 [Streptomyces sp. NBC_00391]
MYPLPDIAPTVGSPFVGDPSVGDPSAGNPSIGAPSAGNRSIGAASCQPSPARTPYSQVAAGTGAAGVVGGIGIITDPVVVPADRDGATRLSIVAGAMSGA